jgi:hypothetical protein
MNENTTHATVSTRSVGMKYGWISALAAIVIFFCPVILGLNPFKGIWNWIAFFVSAIILFLAHKKYRDSDGFMSYGQGVAIGFWMTVISTALSLFVMYVYLNFIDSSPMDLVFNEAQAEIEKSGQEDEFVALAMTWTRKLFWVFVFASAVFWGMIMTLILTIFTQKKAPEQAF